MEVSGEAADVVVRESMAIAAEGAKLAGAAVKNVAAFLLALANAKPQEEKVIIGRVTAKALAKDPAPAVVTPLNKEDLQRFRKLALQYGLPYFVVKPKGKDGPFDVVSTESHAAKLNAIYQALGYPQAERPQPEPAKKASPRAPQGSSSPERGNGSRNQARTHDRPSVRGRLESLKAVQKGMGGPVKEKELTR